MNGDRQNEKQAGAPRTISCAFRLPRTAPFLIDIWRLEIGVTHCKHTAGARSNRHVCGTRQPRSFCLSGEQVHDVGNLLGRVVEVRRDADGAFAQADEDVVRPQLFKERGRFSWIAAGDADVRPAPLAFGRRREHAAAAGQAFDDLAHQRLVVARDRIDPSRENQIERRIERRQIREVRRFGGIPAARPRNNPQTLRRKLAEIARAFERLIVKWSPSSIARPPRERPRKIPCHRDRAAICIRCQQ